MAPREQFIPLTLAQKQVIEFMILYPEHFETLKNSGLREFLAGTAGEILFLDLQVLLRQNPNAGIVDLAGVYAGPFSGLIINALVRSHLTSHHRADSEAASSGLKDIVAYLGHAELRREGDQLSKLMLQAQDDGNLEALYWLMDKKLQLVNLMHSDNSNA